LKDKYGPDKLRIVWKNFPLPFHKQAKPAHVAAQAVFEVAGSEAFWKFHDLAFQNMRALTPANFEAWVGQIGVDKAKWKAAFTGPSAAAKVEADIAAGKPVGVKGTPAFFINGIFLSGARPQAAFEAEIDKQLAEAKKLLAAGTPKDQIYVKLANANKAKAPAGDAKAADKKRPEQDDKTVWKVPVNKADPIKGNVNAQVTIVEFSEYQCPFCTRVLPTIKQIQDTYKDKVRIVFKDNPLPFHKRAGPASMLAHEAKAQKGMKGYWAAHDLLFENQKKLEDEDLWGYAETLGLDVTKVKNAVKNNTHQKVIAANQELAGDIQASGTPHFFINGRRLVGAQPLDKFKTIIDEEIKKTDAMLKKGIAKKDVYAEIMKTGKEPPPPETKEVGAPPKDAPKKGAKIPKVIIHEFSDFECPFCSRVNPTMAQILKDYGDKAQIVWRDKPLPFHKNAPAAHSAAREAYKQKGDKAFWDMHDLLFAGQKDPGLARPALEGYAEKLSLDMGKFKAALDGNTHKAYIDGENEASNKAGIRGTPGFVIASAKTPGKGYFLSGAQPYPKFKKLIDRALKD
jgi:protein-disulfide isomerase